MSLRSEIEDGLARIGVGMGRAYGQPELSLFADVLSGQVSPGEFVPFAMAQLQAGVWRYRPNLTEIQEALRNYRGHDPLEIEAVKAYELVLKSGTYGPEGTFWDHRTIRDRLGNASSDALLAAGGSQAFETTYGEDKRRERFLEAYKRSVRSDPNAGLLSRGPKPKELTG